MNLNIFRTTLLAVAVATRVAAATPPITVESRQLVGRAPATFRIRISVEPDTRNRSVCLQWVQTSGTEEHTSCWSVDGDQEPRTTWKDLIDIRAGKYTVIASVNRSDGHPQYSNALTLLVMGMGYDPHEDNP